MAYSQNNSTLKGERPSNDLIAVASNVMEPGQLKFNESASQNEFLQRSADHPQLINTYESNQIYSTDLTTNGLRNTQALPLPFFEGFEGSSTIPAGWTQEVVNGPLWKVGTGNVPYPSSAYAGSKNLVYPSSDPNAGGRVTRLVTPPLNLTGTTTPVLKFSYVNAYKLGFYSYQDQLTIKYKAALGDEWTTLESFSSDVKEWTDVFIVLPNPSASYYIAFEGHSNGGWGISVDEVTVNESVKITSGNEGSGVIYPLGEVNVPIGSSPRYKLRSYYHFHISALIVDGLPIAEAVGQSVYYYTFPSVNTVHTIMAYFVYSEAYTVTGEAVPPEAGSVNISGNLYYNQTIELDAFESGTRYHFSYWSSNGDSISAANPFYFALLSDTTFQAHYKLVIDPLTMPVYEGFEAGTTLPYGWTEDMLTGPHWKVGNGNSPYPPNAYAGNNNLVYRSNDPNASGQTTRLVSRQIDMTGVNTAVLKFQYVNAEYFNTVAHQDQLTVKYKASYNDSWTTLATFNTNVTEWTEVSIALPNPSKDYFIAFEGKSNAGYGISIDEIRINQQQMEGFFITAGAGGNGSINPSGQVFVPAGETQQFNVKADYGYHISSLLVDGKAIAGAVGESQFTFTFGSVNAAHTVMAYFMPDALSVKVKVFPSGAGSISIQGELYYGNTIKLYAMSTSKKYVFSYWQAGGRKIGTNNPLTLQLLSDTLIEAHFKRKGRSTSVFKSENVIGIESNLSDPVKVYPNPAKDNLHIDLLKNAQVRVFDMQGRLLYEASLTSGTNIINLSGFNQGTYIIKLQFEDQEVVTRKFLRN